MPHSILWVEINRATKPSRRHWLKSNISIRGRDNILTWQRAWIWGGIRTGGPWCDVGDSYGHLHRRHDEPVWSPWKVSNESSFLVWLFWEPLSPALRILSIEKSIDTCPLPQYWGVCVRVWVAQLCPTLWDPMDYSPQGSSVHGILQARSLWWVAAPCSDNPWKRHFAHLLLPSCSNLGKERGVWGGGGLEGRNLCKFCKYLLKGESKFRLMLWKWVLDKDQNPVWSQSGFIKMQIFQTKQDVAIASGSGSLKAYWGHFLVYIM